MERRSDVFVSIVCWTRCDNCGVLAPLAKLNKVDFCEGLNIAGLVKMLAALGIK